MKPYRWLALAAALLITAFEMFSVRNETLVAREVTIGAPEQPRATLTGIPSVDFTPRSQQG